MQYVFRFVLAALAVWRITHLIAREDGPWNIFARLRRAVGRHISIKLVGCFYCLSLWVALPCAWFLDGNVMERLVGWFALSGAAILLERTGQEPVRIEIEEERAWDVVAKQ